jgi:hypothetical protein
MKRSAIVMLLAAMVMSVSVAYAQPREEIKLTTIIPDQHTLRVRKGIVSTGHYRQADFPDSEIQDKALIIDEGNLGIGTTNPQAKLHIGGTAGTDGIMFPNGTLQTTAAGAAPRYKVKYKSNTSVYTIAGFSSPEAQYILSSFGNIQGSDGSWADGSYLFTMTIRAARAVTKTFYLWSVDDKVSFFLDGSLISGPWSVGTHRANINYNIGAGNHTVQIIFNAQGGNDYMSLLGAIVDDVDVFYI